MGQLSVKPDHMVLCIWNWFVGGTWQMSEPRDRLSPEQCTESLVGHVSRELEENA